MPLNAKTSSSKDATATSEGEKTHRFDDLLSRIRVSAIHPCEALLRSLLRSREANEAKDNRFLPIY